MGAVLSVKQCTACGEHKPLEAFSPRQSHCKPCRVLRSRAYNRSYQLRHPEKFAEYTRRFREKHPEHKERDYWNHILRKFGLDSEAYEALLAKQGGGCAICGGPPTANRRWPEPRYAVDHDHTTGKIRGLLCFGCNTGLGNFKDSLDLLQGAARYLEEPPWS